MSKLIAFTSLTILVCITGCAANAQEPLEEDTGAATQAISLVPAAAQFSDVLGARGTTVGYDGVPVNATGYGNAYAPFEFIIDIAGTGGRDVAPLVQYAGPPISPALCSGSTLFAEVWGQTPTIPRAGVVGHWYKVSAPLGWGVLDRSGRCQLFVTLPDIKHSPYVALRIGAQAAVNGAPAKVWVGAYAE
jgi:hypothetical protein